jgi:hypothetical protein
MTGLTATIRLRVFAERGGKTDVFGYAILECACTSAHVFEVGSK